MDERTSAARHRRAHADEDIDDDLYRRALEVARKPDPVLQELPSADQVLCHPMILVEIACGTLPSPRARTLSDFKELRSATVASAEETLELIEREQLQESGCGAVDLLFMPPSAFSRPCFARGSAGCERARYRRACRAFGQGQQAANRMHTVDSGHIEGHKRKRVSRR